MNETLTVPVDSYENGYTLALLPSSKMRGNRNIHHMEPLVPCTRDRPSSEFC